MSSIANRNSRRGMRLLGAFGGVTAAILLIAAVTVLPAQAAATSATEIQALAVHPGQAGAQLEVASDGALIWTTYRDADGQLVIELPNSMPADSVVDLWPDEGLLEAVEVATENGGDRPLTRLTIRTRGATEHSIEASGPALLVNFTAIGEIADTAPGIHRGALGRVGESARGPASTEGGFFRDTIRCHTGSGGRTHRRRSYPARRHRGVQ